jgi:hypothetical protein
MPVYIGKLSKNLKRIKIYSKGFKEFLIKKKEMNAFL